VWFRYLLVRIRNVAPAQHQAGQRRIGQSDRIICQIAKNKPVELLGRGADGRHRLAVGVGKIARMIWLISDPDQIGDELLPTEIGDLDVRIRVISGIRKTFVLITVILENRLCSIDRSKPSLRVIERPSPPTRPDAHSTNGLSAS
jgi:hypothetical protein